MPRAERRTPSGGARYAGSSAFPSLGSRAFFISARYGEFPSFIFTGAAADSEVWYFDTDKGTVTLGVRSVWDWIEAFVVDAERWVVRGIPEQHARRG